MPEWATIATAIATIVLSAIGMAGGAYSFWTQRRHRRALERLTSAQADGKGIENLTDLLVAIDKQREQLEGYFDEIIELKSTVADLQDELARTTKKHTEEIDRMRMEHKQQMNHTERIVTIAINHIEKLGQQLTDAGITPYKIPYELEVWKKLHGRDKE